MRFRTAILATMMSAAWPAIAAKPTPPPATLLAPSGKWTIEYAKDMCVLTRAFGTGSDAILFALKPAPNSDQARIMLIRKTPTQSPHVGTAIVRLSDGSVPSYAQAKSSWAKGVSLTAIDLPRSSLDPLIAGGTITIRFGGKINATFAPTGMAAAVKQLGACERDLLTGWGMTVEAQDAIAQLPRLDLRPLFRNDDYPNNLLNAGVQGSVGALMRVDATGAVDDCKAIEQSGTAQLDDVTCQILRKRAKYQPAIDRLGKPVPALIFYRINWMIADEWGSSTDSAPPVAPSMGEAR